MTYKTHSAFSFAVTSFAAYVPQVQEFLYSHPYQIPVIAVVLFVTSLAPDLDEPGSYLSRTFPFMFFSWILSLFVTHRGVTHQIWFPTVLFFILFFYVNRNFNEYTWLVALGYVSYIVHILGDSFTRGGVKRCFYPFTRRTFWGLPKGLRFYTGSFTENIWLIIFTFIFLFNVAFNSRFVFQRLLA